MIVEGILLGLAAVLDAQRDKIVYKPQSAWFSGKWWVTQNYLVRELAGKPVWLWLVKYPFSFLINGWHLCKSLSLVCLLMIAFPWEVAILAYVLYGIIFNLFYV